MRAGPTCFSCEWPSDAQAGPALQYTLVDALIRPQDPVFRDWRAIKRIIGDGVQRGGALTPGAAMLALDAFGKLAVAEAACHGLPVDDVHFHEVGARAECGTPFSCTRESAVGWALLAQSSRLWQATSARPSLVLSGTRVHNDRILSLAPTSCRITGGRGGLDR